MILDGGNYLKQYIFFNWLMFNLLIEKTYQKKKNLKFANSPKVERRVESFFNCESSHPVLRHAEPTSGEFRVSDSSGEFFFFLINGNG